jgi:transposase
MEKIIAELKLEKEQWQQRCHELEKKVEELEALVKYYEEEFRLLKHKHFGKSSEKTEPVQQAAEEDSKVFNETEQESDTGKAEPELEEITYKRRKRKGKREEDLSELPVETVEHVLPESERICPECGGLMHPMGHETRRELEIIPAQVKVVEHISEVYSCRTCEQESIGVPIIKAPAPEPVISGSLASPSLVAHIMTQKYVNAVPLYRQEQDFLRNGIQLSRQTMANWMVRCAEDWLTPLYDRMKERLLKENKVLHADETVLQVLKEPGKKADTNSYMWLYRTSREASHPIVLYEYQPTRSSAHPAKFLETFEGYLHVDGYSGYHNLSSSIIIVGCLAHARRKFDEALKTIPPEKREGSESRKGLEYCNQLFALEREYTDARLSPEDRYQRRLEQSKPVFDALSQWATSTNALPKSALGRAIHYFEEQRPYLENVFLDGRLELSNNRAERSIKPFVIGRKNWLFSATVNGAKASSAIYSMIETAKENSLKPYEYLKYLFESLPNANTTGSTLDSLLPWSSSLPDDCRSKSKVTVRPPTENPASG